MAPSYHWNRISIFTQVHTSDHVSLDGTDTVAVDVAHGLADDDKALPISFDGRAHLRDLAPDNESDVLDGAANEESDDAFADGESDAIARAVEFPEPHHITYAEPLDIAHDEPHPIAYDESISFPDDFAHAWADLPFDIAFACA